MPLEQGEFHLDDYVNYVQEFIRHLQAVYGNCHVISVCQPTVPVLAAVSLMATRGEMTPLTMTMMGGPIDARKSPTAVNNLAMNKSYEWFENNVIYRVPTSFPGAGRRVYPGFLQHTGFVAMNPDRHLSSHYDYFKHLIKGDDASAEAHRKFYDEYNAVLDMDADYYLDTIRVVFQEFALVNGTWDVISDDGELERVRPQDIKTTAHFTDRRRAGRHLRLRPDRSRARALLQRAQVAPEAPGGQGRRPLRHLQRPPLARNGVPAGARLHPQIQRRPDGESCRQESPQGKSKRLTMKHPRSACGASPSRGRSQRPGKAGSAATPHGQ